MRAFNGHAQTLRQESRLPAVVNMPMGEQDFLNRDARVFRMRLEFVKISARVDKRRPACLGADDQRTVLLKLGYRDDFELHGAIIAERLKAT